MSFRFDADAGSTLNCLGPLVLPGSAVWLMVSRGDIEHVPAVIFSGRQPELRFAECVECGRVSGPYWIRWRACRVDEPETDDVPEIALYCPACAQREFGLPRRRPLLERRSRPR